MQPVPVLWLAVYWMFMNIQIMIIISANLPASDLFFKENNADHKGAVSTLLKSSTKYSPELFYLQQSYYFALCHFSLFLFFSLQVFYFLFFFFFSFSDDAFRTCCAPCPSPQDGRILVSPEPCFTVEPSRAPQTLGRGLWVLSHKSRDSHHLPWLVTTSSQVIPEIIDNANIRLHWISVGAIK